jgi:DNA-binding MarR family transcriptional regulator
MGQEPTKRTAEGGFLIGALTSIVFDEVRRRVYQGYQAAGFGDLTPAHNPVFIYLSPDGDRIVDLAKRVGITKQAMGYLVRYLEERGYVERVPHPTDGRAQLVRRTERGWAVNRLARRLVQETQDDWAAQIGQERMEQLIALLRDLVRLIGVGYRGSTSQIAHAIDSNETPNHSDPRPL